MYAAAKAKPQSIEAEHLGSAAISEPHLVATYKPGRELPSLMQLKSKPSPPDAAQTSLKLQRRGRKSPSC